MVAAVLLLAGGLKALQTAALASALPFAVVMLCICYGMLRALQTEAQGSPMDLSGLDDGVADTARPSWQQRLSNITSFYDEPQIRAFLNGTGRSVLDAVAGQMRDSGLTPVATYSDDRIELSVPHGDRGEFEFAIRARSFRSPSFAWAESDSGTAEKNRHYRAMARWSDSHQQHDVTGYTRDQLINELLNAYARCRHARRLS